MPTLNNRHYKKADLQRVSVPEILQTLPDETIQKEFFGLYEATASYVKTFYTTGPVKGGGASQMMIEQAGAGVLLPWPQILDLLGDGKTRPGTLTMCIARTMLGRSLLLRLGSNNGPGATFLPPELIDCFQSFCSGNSAATFDGREPKPINFALLSRWKQISGTLLQSTYVVDAFSPFDGRTINIERAMEDLSPLLSVYALPQDADSDPSARLSELRGVLRRGARLAFTLFSQPCLWKFDWYGNREIEVEEGQLAPSKDKKFESSDLGSESRKFPHSPAETVIWPRLLKIMDHNGCRLDGEKNSGMVLGDKIYLDQLF